MSIKDFIIVIVIIYFYQYPITYAHAAGVERIINAHRLIFRRRQRKRRNDKRSVDSTDIDTCRHGHYSFAEYVYGPSSSSYGSSRKT